MPDVQAGNGREQESTRDSTVQTEEAESVQIAPADVESAGRSCMAIIILAALVLLVLAFWLTARSFGVGQ